MVTHARCVTVVVDKRVKLGEALRDAQDWRQALASVIAGRCQSKDVFGKQYGKPVAFYSDKAGVDFPHPCRHLEVQTARDQASTNLSTSHERPVKRG